MYVSYSLTYMHVYTNLKLFDVLLKEDKFLTPHTHSHIHTQWCAVLHVFQFKRILRFNQPTFDIHTNTYFVISATCYLISNMTSKQSKHTKWILRPNRLIFFWRGSTHWYISKSYFKLRREKWKYKNSTYVMLAISYIRNNGIVIDLDWPELVVIWLAMNMLCRQGKKSSWKLFMSAALLNGNNNDHELWHEA